jgi:endonuclease/exonuclease/phosphatase family metal-dependent hydrolase
MTVALRLAVTVALATFATSPRPLPGQEPIRAVSFNIRYGTANDGEHRWERRREAVFQTIRSHAAHVLGIQEALRFQLDEIDAAVPGYRVIGVGRDDGREAGEFAAILVDTARFEVPEEGTFWLSDTPEVPGSMHWGNRITRIMSWARLVDRSSGDTLHVLNAHWDHESQASREKSAEALLAALGPPARAGAAIVLGDFNADERNPAFRRLLGGGLRDTFRSRHPDHASVGTFNAFRGDSLGGKIDAVLVGGAWEVVDAGIDRTRWDGVLASDHYAVWAIIHRRR